MSEPVLTVQQAAEAAGVSRSTIYRYMDELMEHGATRDGKTTHIPFSALITTGLASRTSPPEVSNETLLGSAGTEKKTPSETRETDAEKELRERLIEAQGKIKDLEHAKALAEAIAAERERIIEVQSRALRLLEAAPMRNPETSHKKSETRNETSAKPLNSSDIEVSDTTLETPETIREAYFETSPKTPETPPQTASEQPGGAGVPEGAGGRSKRRWWPF